jgi:outer membrane receptor protein involved in Fe transport
LFDSPDPGQCPGVFGRLAARVLVALVLAEATAATAWAAPPEGPALEPASETPSAYGSEESDDESDSGTREIVVDTDGPDNDERDASVVTRKQMQERLPRSAPDALRYEPGVFVQQTAHSQASPYVRGVTGQQTLMAFDGIRLNNATFRQGPNQYFFTVDSRTIRKLEVVRGSASTRWGSDAIGGAFLTTPLDPTLDPSKRWVVHPRLMMTTRTSDGEVGGRAQMDVGWRGKFGVLGGIGYREVGQLRTAGAPISPTTGMPWKEPRLASDERTQIGTGFRELTADTRLVWQVDTSNRLTAAYYDYRQFDAPRTDKCPPPEAPDTTCLKYLKQFRTLTYLAWEQFGKHPAFAHTRVTVSYQRQFERTQLLRDNGIPEIPGGTESNGQDRVDTTGLRVAASSVLLPLGERVQLGFDYGLDAYADVVHSRAWLRFTDVDPIYVSNLARGQYLDGSWYLTSGAWLEPSLSIGPRVRLRAGGRAAFVHAYAAGEDESESLEVNRTWVTPVGNAGLTVLAAEWLTWHLDVDQGFRAPNLDDLTSRQQTGPGFQYENSGLTPERSLSVDTGFKVRHARVEATAFFWQAFIHHPISRAARQIGDCPGTDISPTGCAASRTRYQLINLDGWAVLRGVDSSVRLFIPHGFALAATLSWAWGDSLNPVPPPDDGQVSSHQDRVPVSRIPPLNGTVQFSWYGDIGLWLGSAVRWAGAQTRLAPADRSDPRIPLGGTPGYAIWDLRAGYRFDPIVLIALVFENVIDSPYRYHGSSVNGAMRSINLSVEVGF